MKDECCCYVIDQGYLFPTVLSAAQARKATCVDTTDIKIFCIGSENAETLPFQNVCESLGVELVFAPPAAIDHMPILFARFFLSRLLDPAYRSIVYVDGDTQISGSLQPLLDIELEPGRFIAAPDPMSILIDQPRRMWRKRRAYLQSIGIADAVLQRYCNSGVLRFNLRDWEAISTAVIETSSRHGHELKFPDQDALNLMFGTDYLTMSYRWNFPSFFLACGFEDLITPTIYHFMSNPRPWHGPFQPWGDAWHEPYLRLASEHPELARFHKAFGPIKTAKYIAQQRIKSAIELPLWRSSLVRERIERHEARAYV
ncbi:glycosyl transferase [Kaistia sp. 32K]|uniref:glycosyltransferase family 8 protein n=1 Tax=Kaistia sp. 32K TaxID=2795690 RepID=UPI0019162CFC|nr:glycosyltransferase [Kaistia sp. 32K]BCP52429.1 glycosyl transferase [Kaistia sp. 32K]